ncbi:MAG: hypothetical protein FJ090_02365 [Deltaproteobacteria bacterium]|nr:hypothetical protein [Deltaproteobacteria bacterium]
MPRPDQVDIGALLGRLGERGIDFVVVGGAAALLHAAPIATRDLDIVPDARPGAREHLDGGGQLLLRTRLCPLDVLLRLHGGPATWSRCPCSCKRFGSATPPELSPTSPGRPVNRGGDSP